MLNGRVVDFPMKVGEAGEAFFVMETDVRYIYRPSLPFSNDYSPFLSIDDCSAARAQDFATVDAEYDCSGNGVFNCL
jgi:phosphatidate phosphatase PAH1